MVFHGQHPYVSVSSIETNSSAPPLSLLHIQKGGGSSLTEPTHEVPSSVHRPHDPANVSTSHGFSLWSASAGPERACCVWRPRGQLRCRRPFPEHSRTLLRQPGLPPAVLEGAVSTHSEQGHGRCGGRARGIGAEMGREAGVQTAWASQTGADEQSGGAALQQDAPWRSLLTGVPHGV